MFRLSPIPCALTVYLESAVHSTEFKVLTCNTEEPRVESSICATIL